MAEWTHRICERCWFDGTPFMAAPGENPDGTFRSPVQVKEVEPAACCSCGGLTITGIFFRRDETELLCRGRHDDPRSWAKVGLSQAD